MAASELTGKELWLSFNSTVISTDFRNFEEALEVDTVDVTAASDDDRTYVPMVKDGTFDYTGLYLSAGAGTAIWDALAEGTEGTLIWATEGSVANKPKWSCNAIVTGRSRAVPYDGAIEISASFQKSGAITSGTI
jgi:hypothetical protein